MFGGMFKRIKKIGDNIKRVKKEHPIAWKIGCAVAIAAVVITVAIVAPEIIIPTFEVALMVAKLVAI